MERSSERFGRDEVDEDRDARPELKERESILVVVEVVEVKW